MNFNVAIRPLFAVVTAVLGDSNGAIVLAITSRLPSMDANMEEAHATLLAVNLAISECCDSLFLEGGSLITILAINKPYSPRRRGSYVLVPVNPTVLSLCFSYCLYVCLMQVREKGIC
jgi:hypothetical protein